MSFLTVRNNTRSRFTENQLLLNYIVSLEPLNPTDIVPLEVHVMKGLFYVHLYSSLEKSVNELIENTLIHIDSKSVKYKHFITPFYSISLIDKLKSFKDCGNNNFFNKAAEIFSEASSENICSLHETAFSNNLQNVWIKTVREVCYSFGITSFNPSHRTRATIDEIVDKRNAVAHGRESARTVGERFRANEIRKKMDITVEFSIYLIDLFEEYYNNKKFVKPAVRRYYT